MTTRDPDDPRGLIRDAYAIDGIRIEECRSIFLDWAMGHPGDARAAIPRMIEAHGTEGHPMTEVLRAGLAVRDAASKRRGGRRGRMEAAIPPDSTVS